VKPWPVLAIVAATAVLAGGGLVFSRSSSSTPAGAAGRFRDAVAELNVDELGALLSTTGRNRLKVFTGEVFSPDMRSMFAKMMEVPEADVKAWQGVELLSAFFRYRSKLVTKGFDFEKELNPEQFRTMAKALKIGEPAIDGDHATVPLYPENGKASYLDMERENGRWGVSYWRTGDEEPLWDPKADIQLLRFNKRSRASEAKTNLKSFHTDAYSYFSEHDKVPTTFDIFVDSFSPGRYTYFFADKGAAGAALNRDEVLAMLGGGPMGKPNKGAVILPPNTERNPDAPVLTSYSGTQCPLTLKTANGPALAGIGAGKSTWLFAAAGNIDNDADLDCWSLSNVDRIAADGESIPSGVPFQEHAD